MAILVAATLCIVGGGCDDETVLPRQDDISDGDRHEDALFQYSVENLNRLAEFGPHEILTRIVERLNQWERTDRTHVTWDPDLLIATLPTTIQGTRLIEELSRRRYSPYDGVYLREAMILRDIARHVDARGEGNGSELQRARKLFQWTVNNIALDAEPAEGELPLAQMPWHTVVFGHGRAIDRTWVFTLLARQQGLDVVLLSLPKDTKSSRPTIWTVALLSDGHLYLFDPRLGLPLPGPDGQGVATLEQLATDDALLRQLDTDQGPYPITASQLTRVQVSLEGSGPALSYRMKRIAANLTGRQRAVLTCEPSELATRVRKLPHVGRVELWEWPYQAEQLFYGDDSPSRLAVQHQMAVFERFLHLRINPLWSARLRHLAGQFETLGIGESSLSSDSSHRRATDFAPEGQQGAKAIYLESRMLASHLPNEGIPKEFEKYREQLTATRARAVVIKQLATFWLGMINLETGEPQIALEFFKALQDKWPEGWGASGVPYNYARALQSEAKATE